jgi:hypothetical protein
VPPPVGRPNDQGPAPRLDEFVLYAQRSIALTADEKITGNVGVHAAALGVSGSQLHVGAGSQISARAFRLSNGWCWNDVRPS